MLTFSALSTMATKKPTPQYGRSYVARTYGGTSYTNTQFTKDVSFHYFPDKAKDPKR